MTIGLRTNVLILTRLCSCLAFKRIDSIGFWEDNSLTQSVKDCPNKTWFLPSSLLPQSLFYACLFHYCPCMFLPYFTFPSLLSQSNSYVFHVYVIVHKCPCFYVLIIAQNCSCFHNYLYVSHVLSILFSYRSSKSLALTLPITLRITLSSRWENWKALFFHEMLDKYPFLDFFHQIDPPHP